MLHRRLWKISFLLCIGACSDAGNALNPGDGAEELAEEVASDPTDSQDSHLPEANPDTASTDGSTPPATPDAWAEEEGDPAETALAEEDTDTSPQPRVADCSSYPDSLRFNHIQTLGTHNSYHLFSPFIDTIYQWNYEHLPLNEQMGEQGIRQFELDMYFNKTGGFFEVYHIQGMDEETHCETFTDCLDALRSWSDQNPCHHPFMVLIQVNSFFNEETAEGYLNTLDEELLSVWPEERLITPALIRGESATVRDALAEKGWPAINAVRGRGLFVLHAGGSYGSVYLGSDPTATERPLFQDAYGDASLPYAAIHSLNNPIGDQEAIQDLVDLGHMVRTRSDSDTEEALAEDYTRFEAALTSGAHFISTDFPGEPYGESYAVQIPGGTPSRCNPISAPEDCTSEGIETGLWNPEHE